MLRGGMGCGRAGIDRVSTGAARTHELEVKDKGCGAFGFKWEVRRNEVRRSTTDHSTCASSPTSYMVRPFTAATVLSISLFAEFFAFK